MKLKDYLTIIIPSCVTLLGFIISFLINKVEFFYNIKKLKTEKRLSDLYGIQKDVFEFVDDLCYLIAYPDKKPTGFDELREKINSVVICSGSEDAVKLIVYIRELVFSKADDEIDVPNSELIACYILLAMQIKYDTTGIKTSPNAWYAGKFTTQKMLDSSDFYDRSIDSINRIVEQLQLKEFLRIDL